MERETWMKHSSSKKEIKSSNENLNTTHKHTHQRERHVGEPGSATDYDKVIGRIFRPSCRGSQEQLQRQGNIHAAVPLLRSLSRSIINDMEKQGEIHPGPAGWHTAGPREEGLSGVAGGEGKGQVASVIRGLGSKWQLQCRQRDNHQIEIEKVVVSYR